MRAAAEICRRLEGLPLAVELAAARLRLLAPTEIVRRLDNQLNFLTAGRRDFPARHQTIRAAIAWSYNLLSQPEKLFFDPLSIFAGDFSIEAAEFLFDRIFEDSVQKPLALDCIESLAAQSLVQKIETDAPNDAARFRLLEPLRQFAAENLEQANALETTQKIHAEYFADFAVSSERERRGANQSRWLARLKAENENLRRAVEFLLETNAEKALETAVALHVFWLVDLQFAGGRRTLAAALEKTKNQPSVRCAFAYKASALLAWKQGDYKEAKISTSKP
jgi:predicted ATPase